MPPVRRPGMHLRGNRVSGSEQRLNENAVKVLATIKFAPQSITREEIMNATSLSREDTERQVRLLLNLRLIKGNRMFPQFPTLGWRVFTERDNHRQIMNILHRHGYEDTRSQHTREMLGDYYPTGMALEGQGRQETHGRGYPPDVPINEDLEYRDETMQLMDKWRDEKKPFRPKEYSQQAVREKRQKFQWLSDRLADIYHIRRPRVVVGRVTEQSWNAKGSSGSSNYRPATHTITIEGKFSVITFIHEFGHARGFDETDTVLWSVNLFKRVFPVSYSKLVGEGHTLVQQEREPNFRM